MHLIVCIIAMLRYILFKFPNAHIRAPDLWLETKSVKHY